MVFPHTALARIFNLPSVPRYRRWSVADGPGGRSTRSLPPNEPSCPRSPPLRQGDFTVYISLICMYAYLFTKMYANGSIHICFLQNMYGHRYIDIFVYVCICLCIYAQLCAYLNECGYAYMKMYICTCICIVFSRSSFGKDPICNLPERDVAPRCRVQKKCCVYVNI